jgi:inner membrane protein
MAAPSVSAPISDRRSLGLKFLLVCLLVLLMSLPAFAVFGLIYERTNRSSQVVAEVGERFGGPQTFTGPVLVAPWRAVRTINDEQTGRPVQRIEEGWYVVFAKTGSGDAEIDTDVRARGGLFRVRTYTANVGFNAAFDLTNEPSAAPAGATVDWSRAALLIKVGDSRGAKAAALEVSGVGEVAVEPGSAYAGVFGAPGEGGQQWIAAKAGGFARPGAKFDAVAKLTFSGVESIGLGAFAKDTSLSMRGDWPHVGYFGAYPPEAQVGDVADGGAAAEAGFQARWRIPFVARGVAEAGDARDVASYVGLAVQTNLIDPSNPYKAVERALKYAILFLGVVFLVYFLFEATGDRRVHPAQYILVGLAQIVFYLLLLSLSERIGFDWAFVAAAGVTVLQIGLYAGAVFKDRQRGLIAVVGFSVLYALIYLLMKLEDYALLVGSIAAAIVLMAAMWFTRNLDWYGLGFGGEGPRRPADPAPQTPPGAFRSRKDPGALELSE